MLQQQFHAPVFQRCLPAWVSKEDVLADVFMCLQADSTAILILWVPLPLLTFSSSTLPLWAPTSNVVKVRAERLLCTKRLGKGSFINLTMIAS